MATVSLTTVVSSDLSGTWVVTFADPTVPLVAAWSSGLKVIDFGSLHAKKEKKEKKESATKSGFIKVF
jgi:hypothetical protein